MAWRRRPWPRGLGSPRSSRVICCGPIARHTDNSGAGPMLPSTRPCSPVRCIPCLVGKCTSARIPIRDRCVIFPMQANGAEMLRLACCLATERGIEVCSPVHDAVLISAPLDQLEDDVGRMRAAMAQASRIILAGFELGTDANLIQ